jgi:hypothetical protein
MRVIDKYIINIYINKNIDKYINKAVPVSKGT